MKTGLGEEESAIEIEECNLVIYSYFLISGVAKKVHMVCH